MFAGLDPTQAFLVFKVEQQKYICLQRVTWKRERQEKSGQCGEEARRDLGNPGLVSPSALPLLGTLLCMVQGPAPGQECRGWKVPPPPTPSPTLNLLFFQSLGSLASQGLLLESKGLH